MPALINYADSKTDVVLQSITRAWHRKIASRHGLLFLEERGAGQLGAIMKWMKTAVAGDTVALIDAAALWIDQTQNPAQVTSADVAMLWDARGWFDASFIFIRATRETRETIQRLMWEPPVNDELKINGAFSIEALPSNRVKTWRGRPFICQCRAIRNALSSTL